MNGAISLAGFTTINGGLKVIGSKNRLIKTKNYGNRLLDAYETPTPTFSDYGIGRIDDGGNCYIAMDPVFLETVTKKTPIVFLTKYGPGDAWVNIDDTNHDIVHICGTPGLRFAWEARYEQRNAWTERLREFDPEEGIEKDRDYESENLVYIEHEMPDILPSALEYAEQIARMSPDYGELGINEYIVYEKTSIDYSEEGFEYFESFERSIEFYE